MSFIRKPLVLLAVVFALMPTFGFAQYVYEVDPFFSYFKDLKRYEIGGGASLASGTFTGVVQVNGPNYRGDTTATRNMTSTGFGGSIGLSVPIKGTGHISYWAVALQLTFNDYIWQNLNQTLSIDNQYKTPTTALNASSYQICLPIGIDYKAGCDAILSKRLRFGTALGAGVIPQFNMTSLEGVTGFDPGYRFGVTPYAKIDLSVFAGLCFKVRVMYTLGSLPLLDVNRQVAPTLNDGPFNITSKSNLMISLMIMPFAPKWEESAWYNTYDTYNQHDRFN